MTDSNETLFDYSAPLRPIRFSQRHECPMLSRDIRCWLDDTGHGPSDVRFNSIECLRHRPWSAVYKISRIGAEPLYLKVPHTEFNAEGALSELVGRIKPNLTTKVYARCPFQNAFLLAASGELTLRQQMRAAFDPTSLQTLLNLYAEFQLSTRSHLTEAHELGAPNWRPGTLANLLRGAFSTSRYLNHSTLIASDPSIVGRACTLARKLGESLACSPIPPMIDHGDFQDNNALVSQDGVRISDWADVSITHPFFSLATYCHSIQLAYPRQPLLTSTIKTLVTGYANTFGDFGDRFVLARDLRNAHQLYPAICILKSARLLSLEQQDVHRYASQLIDYWVSTFLELQ